MRPQFILLILSFTFSNFVLAEDDTYTALLEIKCNSQAIKLKTGIESIAVLSIKTNRKTELNCSGQCSIDQWACVVVDDIPYLWLRGTNAERYTSGPIDGHEYLGHWVMQLNEIDWGSRLKHQHMKDLSGYFKMLDKTKDKQIILNPSGVDYIQSVSRSTYGRVARAKYPYISKVYESAQFLPIDFQ